MNNKLITVIAVIASLSACMPITEKKPRKNSSPSSPREIEFYVEEPAANTKVAAIAGYEVVDRKCLPLDYTKAIGGVRVQSLYWESLQPRKSNDGKYSVTAYEDYFVTEPLYGEQSCSWELSNVSLVFTRGDLARNAALSSEDVRSERRVVFNCDFSREKFKHDICTEQVRSSTANEITIVINGR